MVVLDFEIGGGEVLVGVGNFLFIMVVIEVWLFNVVMVIRWLYLMGVVVVIIGDKLLLFFVDVVFDLVISCYFSI